MPKRCEWCGDDPLYVDYHDTEWGVPVYDDRLMFEFLILEGFQAGLSWLTILKKRENFRAAFNNFDAEKIARYRQPKLDKLMQDAGIIRNKLKIESAVTNARAYLKLCEERGSLCDYLWDFVDGKPVANKWKSMAEIPAVTPLAETISRNLKARGFKFVGPTIVYAHLQAAGLVNDHVVSCFRHKEVKQLVR